MKDFERNYRFEQQLIDFVMGGDVYNAVSVYKDFINSNYPLKTSNCKLRSFKNYIISISSLLCHEVIRTGVSSFDAKAKYHAFAQLVEQCCTVPELVSIGEKLIKGYSMQVRAIFTKSTDGYISKAIDYINNSLAEDVTLEMVAEQVKLSKCYLCTLFKKQMGMSFSHYLNKVRLERSKFYLLHSEKSIVEIAMLLGFNSQSYYSTQFRKLTGMTPMQFRSK